MKAARVQPGTRRISEEIKHNLLVRIARLYYLCNMTHQEIADQEGVSRIKITRLLKEAVDKKIVEFSPFAFRVFLQISEKGCNIYPGTL